MMYAVVVIRYGRPMEEVAQVTPDHRAYLAGLHQRGILLASGPFEPRTGGMLLLRIPDDNPSLLEQIRNGDPFHQRGIADYELLHWAPTIGVDSLDRL
jgi:uncharacterized protein YciI